MKLLSRCLDPEVLLERPLTVTGDLYYSVISASPQPLRTLS